MNFMSLDYFIMVARERSFTKAAARLHVIHFAEGTQYMIRFGYLKQSYEWSMLSKFVACRDCADCLRNA